jgi:hypothetical protein
MKFSFEVPISYMKKFDKVNDYHFILAHMLLKDKDYARFYKQSKKFKILDNGCAELGKSIDTNKLVKLAVDYKVDVLVLPDIWMNGSKTYKESLSAIQLIYRKFPKIYKKLNFMFVIQGNSIQDFYRCYTDFESKSFLSMWSDKIIYGIPYMTCAKICATLSPNDRDDDVTNARIRIVQRHPSLVLEETDVHLLGAGFNFSQEISFMRHHPLIKTADTSTPFVLAANGIKLDKYGLFERVIGKAGTLDFYAKFKKCTLDLAIHNAQVLKGFAKL